MNFDDLSPELQEKVKGCASADELLALAKENGYELSNEELEGVSAGCGCSCDSDCRDCPSYSPCVTYNSCPGYVSSCPKAKR